MRDLIRAIVYAREMDKDYGRGFGLFFVIVILAAATLFLAIAGNIFDLHLKKDNDEEFLLDSPSKYKIVLELPDKLIYYYEVDLTEGTVVKRYDDEEYKRRKVKTINTDTAVLGALLDEVTGDENNIGLTAEEREKLHEAGCHWIFKVETSSGEEYYLKDASQVYKLRVLIDEN